ncbi:hypothetical protein RND81_14G088600 [Saponaria officinalis]|uniref:Ig-like domain-containing protein n=1 Tax=Saponaria officinalis TaxID=3572 RepID=A0AAW1GJE0_SAPOF
MENIILKMNYRGRSVSIKVDDTDKCALIDVINELYDEAEANGVHLPKHPSFSYCYKMKYIDLLDDNGLLEMFTRVGERKEIDIWIGQDTAPSTVLLMARQVRADNMNSTALNSVVADVVQSDGMHTSRPKEKLPIRSSRVSQTSLTRSSQSSLAQAFLSQHKPSQTYSSLPIPSQPATQVTDNSQRFKMPKATAKKRGVYMPKPVRETVVEEGIQRMATRGARAEYEVEDDESESDDSYEPSETELADDVEDMTDLEVEDNIVLSTLDCIDDGYDPYKQYEWTADERGYSS